MIHLVGLNQTLVQALPELQSDLAAYEERQLHDPEFHQSFFGYSFIPTLQVALDQHVESFCRRAFAAIEQLLAEGDTEVRAMVIEEFFEYGPACEKWMKRASGFMGPLATNAASRNSQSSL